MTGMIKRMGIAAALIVAAALATVTIPPRQPLEAAAAAPVVVTNTPLPVADDPARRPFGMTLCLAFGEDAVAKCQTLGEPSSFNVPTGQELVVEQVSGTCSATTGTMLLDVIASTQTGGTSLNHRFPVTHPVATDTTKALVFATTRTYADPGSSMSMEIGEVFQAGPLSVPPQQYCNVAVTGHLVDR